MTKFSAEGPCCMMPQGHDDQLRAELAQARAERDAMGNKFCEAVDELNRIVKERDALAEKVKQLDNALCDANYWRKRHSDEAEIYAQRSVSTFEERKQLTAKLARAEGALRRLHDECSDNGEGDWLEVGPMTAPSEQAVLDARWYFASAEKESTAENKNE